MRNYIYSSSWSNSARYCCCLWVVRCWPWVCGRGTNTWNKTAASAVTYQSCQGIVFMLWPCQPCWLLKNKELRKVNLENEMLKCSFQKSWMHWNHFWRQGSDISLESAMTHFCPFCTRIYQLELLAIFQHKCLWTIEKVFFLINQCAAHHSSPVSSSLSLSSPPPSIVFLISFPPV